MTEAPHVRHEPVPEHPGWHSWSPSGERRFHETIAPVLVRREGERRGRCRMFVEERHLNLSGAMHGGAILTFIDMALFAGGYVSGAETRDAVTVDLSTQFVGPARPGSPLDADVELVRETGSLVFLRGTVAQQDAIVASFTGTLRKGRRRA